MSHFLRLYHCRFSFLHRLGQTLLFIPDRSSFQNRSVCVDSNRFCSHSKVSRCGTVWTTAGGSIAGFNNPISESSNALAPSNTNRISTKICFSRKSPPICMVASRSGVNLSFNIVSFVSDFRRFLKYLGSSFFMISFVENIITDQKNCCLSFLTRFWE